MAMTADNHLYSSLGIKNYQDLLFVGILENAKEKVKKYIQMAKDIGIDLIEESDSVKWSNYYGWQNSEINIEHWTLVTTSANL